MSKNDKAHKIIEIDEDGNAVKSNELPRVIFIGENKLFKKIKIRKVLFSCALVGFILSGLYTMSRIYAWQLDGKRTAQANNEYIKLAEIDESEVTNDDLLNNIIEESENNNTNATPKVKKVKNKYYWQYYDTKLINVNFTKLKKINNETVAWLKVPGTKINYPVTHGADNDFYLSHTFDKSENTCGWVFLDYRNNGYLTNRNNIIYAHGRVDNIMFGTLKNVLTKSWFNNENNRIIKTSTPTHNDLWEIFSVYVVNEESYYLKTSFESNLDFYNFIEAVTIRSKFDFGINVSFTDKILTLSTCYTEGKRVVVHARLIVEKDLIKSEFIPSEKIADDELPTEEETQETND